jgi:nitrogen fixation protein NifU and related proteins
MSAPDPALLDYAQAVLEEHRRRPRHARPLPVAHRSVARENPVCGDLCRVEIFFEPAPTPEPGEGWAVAARVQAISATGTGCALSQASASLAAASLAGLTRSAALARVEHTLALIGGGCAPELERDGELAALALAAPRPARQACARLAWQAAAAALA